MSEGTIMSYVEQERARCVALCKALAKGVDKDFLIHCIEYSIQPNEVADRRKYFADLGGNDIEDLM